MDIFPFTLHWAGRVCCAPLCTAPDELLCQASYMRVTPWCPCTATSAYLSSPQECMYNAASNWYPILCCQVQTASVQEAERSCPSFSCTACHHARVIMRVLLSMPDMAACVRFVATHVVLWNPIMGGAWEQYSIRSSTTRLRRSVLITSVVSSILSAGCVSQARFVVWRGVLEGQANVIQKREPSCHGGRGLIQYECIHD